MTLGSNIRSYRKSRNMTQAELAKALGVNVYSVTMWENDKFEPTAGNLRALCQTLGCTAEELLDKPNIIVEAIGDRVAIIDQIISMPEEQFKRLARYMELLKKETGGHES